MANITTSLPGDESDDNADEASGLSYEWLWMRAITQFPVMLLQA